MVQILLNAGADVNGRTPNGDTALRSAVHHGNVDIIQVLLNTGADINAPAAPDEGRKTLQVAAERGNASLVRFLLEQGADCNSPAADSKGVTALQAAAIVGNLPIALMLLKAGADINAPAAKTNGRAALEAAAEHGRLHIVSLLLKNETETEWMENNCEKAAEQAYLHFEDVEGVQEGLILDESFKSGGNVENWKLYSWLALTQASAVKPPTTIYCLSKSFFICHTLNH